jgi:hypothetical protein
VDDPAAQEVGEDHIQRGTGLADWFANEAERVYGELADDEETTALRQLVDWIGRKGGTVTPRDLSRGLRAYPTVDDAEGALDGLVKVGAGKWSDPAPGPDGGRPSRRFTLIVRASADADETAAAGPQTEVSSASAGRITPRDDGETRGYVAVATSPMTAATSVGDNGDGHAASTVGVGGHDGGGGRAELLEAPADNGGSMKL